MLRKSASHKTVNPSTQVISTSAARGKATAKKSSRTAIGTRESGTTIWRTGRAGTTTRTEMSTRVSGKTTRLMAKACTLPATGAVTSVSGLTTYNTDKVARAGQTNHRTSGNMKKDRSMARVNTFTAMVLFMMASGVKT